MRRDFVKQGGRRCGCASCGIERKDREIALVGLQCVEARRYLECLKRFRWKWDLEAGER